MRTIRRRLLSVCGSSGLELLKTLVRETPFWEECQTSGCHQMPRPPLMSSTQSHWRPHGLLIWICTMDEASFDKPNCVSAYPRTTHWKVCVNLIKPLFLRFSSRGCFEPQHLWSDGLSIVWLASVANLCLFCDQIHRIVSWFSSDENQPFRVFCCDLMTMPLRRGRLSLFDDIDVFSLARGGATTHSCIQSSFSLEHEELRTSSQIVSVCDYFRLTRASLDTNKGKCDS